MLDGGLGLGRMLVRGGGRESAVGVVRRGEQGAAWQGAGETGPAAGSGKPWDFCFCRPSLGASSAALWPLLDFWPFLGHVPRCTTQPSHCNHCTARVLSRLLYTAPS